MWILLDYNRCVSLVPTAMQPWVHAVRWVVTVFLLVLFHQFTVVQAFEPDAWVCRFPYSPNVHDETHAHPRDCHAYITCQNGYPRVTTCPLGMYYERYSKRCDWPTKKRINQCEGSIFRYTGRICHKNFYARIPLPDSCALYLDCSLPSGNSVYYEKMLECPYPDLFSADLRRCVKFRFAKCGRRTVPVAPCDYLQYRQSCHQPMACLPCPRRHPSCRHKANGPHPMPDHKNLFKVCDSQRTKDVRKCLDYYVYHPGLRKCVASGPVSRM